MADDVSILYGDDSAYANSRPAYPLELFAYLATLTPRRQLAWDCATGNGQAAVGLAEYFDRVLATDKEAAQIDQRLARAQDLEVQGKLCFQVAEATTTGIADASVDLVTVAQGVHWFVGEPFYAEVRRVLRPDGAIAVWCYFHPQVNAEIDAAMWHFYKAPELAPHWSSVVKYVEERYRTLPFPFRESNVPTLTMKAHWDFRRFANYLRTWPAPGKLMKTSPQLVDELLLPVASAWGEETDVREVRWPLDLRVGRP
jgi:ubiquinone/menaquinone biosynthesis C-methylase UbiE